MQGAARRRQLDVRGDDRYRTIGETRIMEMLLQMGWCYERSSDEAKTSSGAALEAWIRAGLGFRQSPNGERLFDPVEVDHFLRSSGVGRPESFYAQRCVRTQRQLVTEFAEKSSSRFAIALTRTFNLRGVPAGRSVRLRIPLPLAESCVENLEVTVDGTPDLRAVVQPGRVEAKVVAAGAREMRVGVKLRLTTASHAFGAKRHVAYRETADYLHAREMFIVVTERVRELAKSLAASAVKPVDAVRRYWEFLNAELMCGAIHYDQIDVAAPCDWVLDRGWFDCQLGASLLIALCRARGIPARLIGGYLLYGCNPAPHYWAEVWIAQYGWMPVDPIGWDLSSGGCDVQWRDRFFGALDARLTTQRMPAEFTGAPGVPVPSAWNMLVTGTAGGAQIDILAIDGSLVYSDCLCVRREDA